MRKIKYGRFLLFLIFVMSIVYSGGDVGSSKVVHADETTKTTYEDFYVELPKSDIDLRDTFELIKAEKGIDSEGGVNDGPSLNLPDRPDVAIITQDKKWQFGGLWYRNPIDMEKDFSMLMYVNLGDKWNNGDYDGNGGADGITFTIQGHTKTRDQLSSTIGANGAGLGAYAKDPDPKDPFDAYNSNFIGNALVLEFDTFFNNLEKLTHDNFTPNFGNGGYDKGDYNGAKFYGHIDLTKTPGADQGPFHKGYHNHEKGYFRSPDNLYDATNQYLTDNRWRKVEVSWNHLTRKLTYDIAGYEPIIYKFDNSQDVINTFGGNLVYWGFTGSTGDSHNLQQVGIFKVPDQTESTIKKLVRNITKDEEDAKFSEEAIMKSGDTIEYQVTLDYPKENNTQDILEAVIKDELPDSLNYVDGSLRVQKNDSDVTPTPDWNDGKIHLGNFGPGNKFVVTYQAVVEEEGVIDNTATFYSKYTNPIDDTATVYSGSINISKVDGNNEPLIGAEFKIEGPNSFNVTIPRSGEDLASSYKVDYLEPGEYIITETKEPDGYLPAAEPQTVMISKGTVDLEVTFINYRPPSVSKEQKNSFEDDEKYRDESETLVGDSVDFRITSSLPEDFHEYKEFRILDELDSRLTYVEESAKIFANSSIELEPTTDYTVQLNNDLLVVELTTAGIRKLADTTKLYLTFTAQVNETALENLTDIPNQSTIEFINKSDQDGSSKSNETNTTPLTGRVDITKIFKNDLEEKTLFGAVFRLQIKSGETWSNFGTDQTSNQAGELHWEELPKGEYRIIEIEAPEGFLLLANPIEFEITSEKTTHGYIVENIPKEELPQTGGIGTVVFTITGLLLMMSAGFSSLITRIKKNNYKKGV